MDPPLSSAIQRQRRREDGLPEVRFFTARKKGHTGFERSALDCIQLLDLTAIGRVPQFII